MINHFDGNGNLWVGVDAATIPETVPPILLGNVLFTENVHLGMSKAVRELNLTGYIKSKVQPDWLNSALTSSTAKITVNGDACPS